jgi:ABC-type polysaccharide/polyol phosphate transport system ATPase subunit
MPADGEILAEGDSWPAIQIENLWKKYGEVEADRGISFEVRKGEIFGLIGPDGAGETSTLQILAGVMEASSGVADVLGRPARKMRAAAAQGGLAKSDTSGPGGRSSIHRPIEPDFQQTPKRQPTL